MAKSEMLPAQEVFQMMFTLSIDYSSQDKFPVHPPEIEERIQRIDYQLREQITLWGGTSALINWIQRYDPDFSTAPQLKNLMRLARVDER